MPESPNENLRHAVRHHAPRSEELPLVHTSRCESLPHFTKCHALEPQPCPVFHENLIYLFYGRPAYKSRIRPGESVELCPICFVFKPNTLSQNFARIYPCDSGAVQAEFFSPPLERADLTNLELDPTIDAIRSYVELFFSTNNQYYFGRVRDPLGASLDASGQRLYKLLSSRGPVRFDDRRSAVEVQVRNSIDLRHKLLYVVLPREFLDDRDVRKAIFTEWNCEPIPYPTYEGDSPAAYYSVLRDRLQEVFSEATRI
jgi:hypothetical protein